VAKKPIKFQMDKHSVNPIEKKSPPIRWRSILAPMNISAPPRPAVKPAIHSAAQLGTKLTRFDVAETSNSACHYLAKLAQMITAKLTSGQIERLDWQGGVQRIIEAARNLTTDLTVVGTHRPVIFRRVRLGNIPRQLAGHAP
jgi:nucleotide-binding universal stress UspA family protein